MASRARATVDESVHDRVIDRTVTGVRAGKDPRPDIERDHETVNAITVNATERPPAAAIMSQSALAAGNGLDQVQIAVEAPATTSITEKTVVTIVVPDVPGISRQNRPLIIPANKNEITTMNAIVHLIVRRIGIAKEIVTAMTIVVTKSFYG